MKHFRPPLNTTRSNIALVGTGIAGMSAAWLLNKGHDVTVYEQNQRIGGHSNTVDVFFGQERTPVDTGFIVYNERSYPNLIALFKHLKVPTKQSDMSFSASLDGGSFEYSGTDLNGLLGQRRNILRPRFWRMLTDILRFYREAPELLKQNSPSEPSLGEYLRANKYSSGFIKDHLLPMGAAIWSTTAPEMEAYPARAFVQFFQSHGLLMLRDRPQWRTVDGGSREYVKRLTASYADRIRFGGVKSIRRSLGAVEITDQNGDIQKFDHVVVATHADEAFKMLADPDADEEKLLGSWRYTKNRAVLHTDPSLMPKRRNVWSSWNFIKRSEGVSEDKLCVTYWMNMLQSLETTRELFVTLNPAQEPAVNSIIQEFDYTHPFFDQAALQSQQELWQIQGRRRTWYCGSYFGYGFHEDALQSGLAVAEQLGGTNRPWNVENPNGRIHIPGNAQELVG